MKKLDPKLETMFLPTESEYSYLSSSVVKEIASFGGDIRQMVPPYVKKMIQKRLKVR